MKLILSLFSVFGILFSCSPVYVASDFNQRTNHHKIVAVLPFQMNNIGKRPSGLSLEDVRKIEAAESTAFQNDLIGQILRITRNDKKPLTVKIQSGQETNALLKQKGYDILKLDHYPVREICAALGVDAIVVGKITKRRYMSALASFGIDVGKGILDDILEEEEEENGVLTQTNNIIYAYSLIDAADATVLSSLTRNNSIDWTQGPEQIIAILNAQVARNFPYIIK